ncbi:MAG TPA: hypothetical protein PLJ80_16845, partial [Accumulibacter sp.]|nr:hypothetical protein [Accumulibacter sp.]
EGTLNALGDDAFISLRNASALPIAYAQLISMEQLAIFERLASLHAQWRQAPSREVTSLDEIFSGSAGDQLVRFE